MTLAEARNVLHVDAGANDELISALITALPSYLELTTGLTFGDQEAEPLVKTVEGLILTQWYYADHADDQSLTRTIDALLKAITLRARDWNRLDNAE